MTHKLVRDKIPEIMLADGKPGRFKTAKGEEYRALLRRKLKEEVKEFLKARGSEQKLEEMADILTVLDFIRRDIGRSEEDLGAIFEAKLEKKGGFERKVVWTGML
jgi:predicted house-cleaning noncanonical NTP pyrophosphatase (MazG superfamily)